MIRDLGERFYYHWFVCGNMSVHMLHFTINKVSKSVANPKVDPNF